MFRLSATDRGKPLKVMEQRRDVVGDMLQNNLQRGRGGINGKGPLSSILLLDTQKCSMSGTIDSPRLISSAVNDCDD